MSDKGKSEEQAPRHGECSCRLEYEKSLQALNVQIAMLLEHPVGRLVFSPRFQQRLFAPPVLQLVAEIRAQLGPRSFASPVVRIVRVD